MNIYKAVLVLLIFVSCENAVENKPIIKKELSVVIAKSNVGPVNDVAVFGGTPIAAWGGFSNFVKLFPSRTLKDHIGYINAVEFSPDGQILASGSSDHNIKLWDVKTEKLLRTFSEHLSATWALVFTADGKSIITGQDRNVVLWRNAAGGQIEKLAMLGHTSTVLTVAISADSKKILSGSRDKTIKIWNADTGELLKDIPNMISNVNALNCHPTLSTFISSGSNSKILIWDLNDYSLTDSISTDGGEIYSLIFHPSGKYIASAGSNGNIYIFSYNDKTLLRVLEGHSKIVKSIKFNREGTILVSGSYDETVRIWSNIF
jgi:hypothetical protein